MAEIVARRGRALSQAARLRQVFTKSVIYILMISWALVAVVPFVWMISTSLKSSAEAQSVRFFPTDLHFENYALAWEEADFAEYFSNSFQITIITLAGQLTFSVLAAYGFARIKFPGRDFIFGVLLSTMMIPAMVLIIPNFLTVTWLGRIGPIKWINNWPALTVPFMGSVFSIFLLRQFFAQVPDELYDAARIDGAGHLRFLWKVVLPLAKAPLMVIVVLSFIGSWNALAWPMLVTNSPEWRPIAVGLMAFVQEAGQRFEMMMAGATITMVPIMILYFITQKQFTESIARSGLKG
jgi:ABC-type glycerol-3-phosphate transport system permease component